MMINKANRGKFILRVNGRHAQYYQEYQDSYVVAVAQRSDDAVVQSVAYDTVEISSGIEHGSAEHSYKERAVNFLCDEGESYRDKRRQYSPCGCVQSRCIFHYLPPFSCRGHAVPDT